MLRTEKGNGTLRNLKQAIFSDAIQPTAVKQEKKTILTALLINQNTCEAIQPGVELL